MRRRRPRNEDGQTAVLVVGLFVVAVLLVVVVVDASAAYLQRQRLDALADGAALAATQAVEGDAVYTRGLGERAILDPAQARAHVAAYLRQVGAHREHDRIGFRVRTTNDSVAVEVSSVLDLPLAPPGWAERTTVTGRAASYVDIVD
jgi:Putative Flp pilus-assembly TadE/G-like